MDENLYEEKLLARGGRGIVGLLIEDPTIYDGLTKPLGEEKGFAVRGPRASGVVKIRKARRLLSILNQKLLPKPARGKGAKSLPSGTGAHSERPPGIWGAVFRP